MLETAKAPDDLTQDDSWMKQCVLPNGLAINHHGVLETDHLYKQIFEQKIYLQHGLTLQSDAIVFDAGANIGLFTLFALQVCPTASVHAVEPAPRTFQLLKANTVSWQRQVKLYNCGLGSEDTEAVFTYFPKVTCGSGFHNSEADMQQRKDMLRSFVLSSPERCKTFEGDAGRKRLQGYLDEALRGETAMVPLLPLSRIIDESQIERIDFLKIDVEGSECNVLRGIADRHWGLIRQIVVEVHDSGTVLPQVVSLLERRGFVVKSVSETAGDISGLAMAYAARPSAHG